MKNIKNVVRAISKSYLSQKKYMRLAYYYNFIAARIKEINIKKSSSYIVDCGLPLIYISQPARSGGTMLRNLFDGHPQCLVFPHELSWQKNGFNWNIFLSNIIDSKRAYKLLYDRWIDHAIVNGINKSYPFLFNRSLQRKIFFSKDSGAFLKKRYWLDKYLTSFFNSWLDYQNLYSKDKKFCVAFCPWNIKTVEETKDFFKYYPDGFRIQLIRNPFAWWASEKNYGVVLRKIENYLGSRWIKSVEIGLQLINIYPDRYLLLNFDEIIKNPERSLRKLCNKIGLHFDYKILTPTFNNIPIVSNTSFGNGQHGIDISVLERWRRHLSDYEIDKINGETKQLYEEVVSKCINH